MYDPQIGRFWQQDPLGELAEGWSLYAYALDNPISFNDPWGLSANDSLPPVTVTPLPVHTPNNTLPGRALIGTPPGGIIIPSAPTTPPEINIGPGAQPEPIENPAVDPTLPLITSPAAILTTVFTLIPNSTDFACNGVNYFISIIRS